MMRRSLNFRLANKSLLQEIRENKSYVRVLMKEFDNLCSSLQ